MDKRLKGMIVVMAGVPNPFAWVQDRSKVRCTMVHSLARETEKSPMCMYIRTHMCNILCIIRYSDIQSQRFTQSIRGVGCGLQTTSKHLATPTMNSGVQNKQSLEINHHHFLLTQNELYSK